MPNLAFDAPVPVRIKDEKFKLLKPALARMGIEAPVFWAVEVTSDGDVIPDPNCLSGTFDPARGTQINGRLCQFEPNVTALLQKHKIPFYNS